MVRLYSIASGAHTGMGWGARAPIEIWKFSIAFKMNQKGYKLRISFSIKNRSQTDIAYS